jgi:hypothetical protein
MGWAQFLKLHWEVLAATDFFTMEVATWHSEVLSSRCRVTRRSFSTLRDGLDHNPCDTEERRSRALSRDEFFRPTGLCNSHMQGIKGG